MSYTEFDLILEASFHDINMLSEAKMTPAQRRKIASLGKSGWEIVKHSKDGVHMSKGKQKLYVNDSGSTYMLSEGQTPIDVTELMETLDEDTLVLTESVISNFLGKFKRTKPKLKIYSNGIDGVICVAEAQGNYSIYHTVNRKIVSEKDNLDADAASDYVEQHDGYRKVSNRARLLSIIGMIGGVGAIAIGAGTIAAIGLRLVFGLLAMREEIRSTNIQAVSAAIEEVKQDAIKNIDASLTTTGGDIRVDVSPLERTMAELGAETGGFSIMSIITTPLFWVAGATFSVVIAKLNPFSEFTSRLSSNLLS